jgi:hypothetical protein
MYFWVVYACGKIFTKKENNMQYSINVNTSKMVKDFKSYPKSPSLSPKYIIIHDTGNGGSALSEAQRLQTASQFDNGIAHYYLDDQECYQLVPTNIKAWHAGDGEYGKGNGMSIGIEVCKSLKGNEKKFPSLVMEEIYKNGLERAYKLASDLCKEYGISAYNIIQHWECSSTVCPWTQKIIFGSYDNAKYHAIDRVNYYLGIPSIVPSVKSILDLSIGEVVRVQMTDTAYKMDTPNWSKARVKLDDFYDKSDILKVEVVSTETGADNTVSAKVLSVLDNARTPQNDNDYAPLGYKYITIKGNINFNQTDNTKDNKLIDTNDKCTIL